MTWKAVGKEVSNEIYYVYTKVNGTKSENAKKGMKNAGRDTDSLKIVNELGFEMC